MMVSELTLAPQQSFFRGPARDFVRAEEEGEIVLVGLAAYTCDRSQTDT